MCGINGIYGVDHLSSAEEEIKKMNKKSAHRGPDYTDFYVDDTVALGHNRLAIIDLNPESNQPFKSNDGNLVMVFNGEIYNYQELREKIPDYDFRTNGDTEVVLAAYQKWGSSFLSRLNGMFALAIWDIQKQELFIARDRLGIKPLYYYDNNEIFAFSSEIRSLMEVTGVSRKLNVEALPDYLRYQTVHAPDTIIEGIKMLLPGHWILLGADEYKGEKWWDINYAFNRKSENQTYDQVKAEVRDLFKKSVARRMLADVPYGAFLSGGIDSSAVVAVMSEVSDRPVKTFNISFAEEEFSEAKYARIIAKKYQTDHTEIKLTPQDFLKELPQALHSMDHPSGDGPNSYIVSKVTKEHGVTMAMSGLGGDELFAGYEIFPRAVSLLEKKWLFSFPINVRRFGGKMLKKLRPSIASDKIAATFEQKYLELPFYYHINRQVIDDELVAKLLQRKKLPPSRVLELGLENVDVDTHGFNAPFLSKVSFMEINSYMQNILLRDTDQMSMASALEVRVPFLDHELVQYVYGIGDEYKFPYLPKKLLVDALEEYLPREIVDREKMGFVFPWKEWMKNDLKSFCEENLNFLKTTAPFDSTELENLWQRFLADDPRIIWSRIWPLVVLGFWLRENEVEV